MLLLDGKKLSLLIQEQLREYVMQLPAAPKLVIVQVGNNPASNTYISMKKKFGAAIGVAVEIYKFDETITQDALLEIIHYCNQEKEITGVIVQLPLPSHLDNSILINTIDATKDVDVLNVINAGKLLKKDSSGLYPATPFGVMNLLTYYGVKIESKQVVIVGRSQLTGLSIAQLMIHAGATVTVTHSKTNDLSAVTKTADILICAAGSPKMIIHEYVKNGAVVVDVGATPMEQDGKKALCGDVDFDDVSSIVSAITPVPGGVGPMTVTSLFMNVLGIKSIGVR